MKTEIVVNASPAANIIGPFRCLDESMRVSAVGIDEGCIRDWASDASCAAGCWRFEAVAETSLEIGVVECVSATGVAGRKSWCHPNSQANLSIFLPSHLIVIG